MEAGPRWTCEYMKRGYVVFSPMTVDHPVRAPGRRPHGQGVHARPLPDPRQGAGRPRRHHGREARAGPADRARGRRPIGYWVGSWRTAPEFLSPRLWNRFVWPYMKELVEIVAEEGGTPGAALRRQLGPRDRAAEGAARPPVRPRARRQDRHLPGQEDPGRAHVHPGRRAAGAAHPGHGRRGQGLLQPPARPRSAPTASSWPWAAPSRRTPSSRTSRRWSTRCKR